MDPEFLLQVPLNLSLTAGSRKDGSIDRVPLLKSIREVSDRITICVQRGQMHVPKKPKILFGLLDRMIVQANAPNGGDFHPKFWFLRFHGSTESDNVLIRLFIPEFDVGSVLGCCFDPGKQAYQREQERKRRIA